MSNIEFIATYIFNHPGARYREIMDAFHTWRGRETGTHLSNAHRSWGCQYFTFGANHHWGRIQDLGYKDKYWTYVKKHTPHSGYLVTFTGLTKVREKVDAFSRKRRPTDEKIS